MFTVVGVAAEELPTRLVFEPFLTFTPSTATWPLQVNTKSLPGDTTKVPGAGSAHKKNPITSVTNTVHPKMEIRSTLLHAVGKLG